MFKNISLALILLFIPTLTMGQPQVIKVMEMAPLPLEEYGEMSYRCRDITNKELDEWEDVYSFVTDLVSDELAKKLSRWAVTETESYVYSPKPTTPLTVFKCNGDTIVYETTLDSLPSHSPIVFRYLKAYIVGVNFENRFLPNAIILTIRGERFE